MPNEFMTNPDPKVENPWRVPIEKIDDRDLDKKERDSRVAMWHREPLLQQLNQQRAPAPPPSQQPQHPPPLLHFQRRPRPSTTEGGTSVPSSSSPSSFDIESAFQTLSLQIEQQHAPPPSIYESHMYDYHVDEGHFAPFVNYPYHPPRHGPVPRWESRTVDDEGNVTTTAQLCYPYWQGQGTLNNPPRSFPPYDYRVPGGCDYRSDPNYPGPAGLPPGYTGGWEPHGPHSELDYEWNPQDPPQ